MRSCLLCGAKYADNIDRCPRDGGAVVDADTPSAEAGPDTDPTWLPPASGAPTLRRWKANAAPSDDPHPSTVIPSGTELGAYKVLELLGRGGMGRVYLALHQVLGKRVAIKVLRASFAANQEAVQQFFREARAACKIEHPNVVAISDFVADEQGHCYYVMEYVQGSTLVPHIEGGALTAPVALALASQIADALAALHAAGVAHLDLKPGNVMLVARPTGPPLVKVLDFGLAHLTGDITGTASKREVLFGTPEYMAPEQVLDQDVDARADIYAFGVLLYEMLSGRRPHEREGVVELLTAVVREPPVPLSQVMPAVPQEIEALVMACLARDPAHRPRTRELLTALISLSESVGSSAANATLLLEDAPTSTMALPPLDQLRRTRKRRIMLIALAAGAGLGVLLVSLYLLLRAPGPEAQLRKPVAAKAAAARATIAELSNRWMKVEHRARDGDRWAVAKTGLRLAHLDAVRTAKGGKAEVRFDGGGQLEIGEQAEVLIERPRAAVPNGPKVVNVTRLRRGELRALTLAGRPLQLIGADGTTARIAALDGKAVRLRLRRGKKGLEIAVLEGRGALRSGDKRVTLRKHQLVDVTRGMISDTVAMLAFPELVSPDVDAELSSAPVVLRWKAVAGAVAYRVQLDHANRAAGLDRRVVDTSVPETELRVPPMPGARYLWRVASVDSKGHEGEFGFARRFNLGATTAAKPPKPQRRHAIRLVTPPAGTRVELGRGAEVLVFRWRPAVIDALLVVATGRDLRRGRVARLGVQGNRAQLSLSRPGRYYWGLCPKAGCDPGRAPLTRPFKLTLVKRAPPKVRTPEAIGW
jgi:serine/threonine protein kinase